MLIDNIVDIIQIIWIDLVLSADNAILIALAVMNIPAQFRQRVIFLGIAIAVVARIIFAILVTYILAIKGMIFLGGVLLTWITWRLYKDIAQSHTDAPKNDEKANTKTADDEVNSFFHPVVLKAIMSIIIADISMSLDNVITVAAIAKHNVPILVFGLAFSIIIMAFASNMIVKLIQKYSWISYVGILFLVYLSADMLWNGWDDVAYLIKTYIL